MKGPRYTILENNPIWMHRAHQSDTESKAGFGAALDSAQKVKGALRKTSLS
jgi:hypothetical protein